MRSSALVFSLIVLLTGAACSDGAEAPRPGRIILFSMDTVRGDALDDLSSSDLPHLAAIAQGGVQFSNFYAASTFTIPSHMSIFTGLDAGAHGILNGERELLPEVATLATRFSAAGYRTHAFHEGAYVGERYGFARGFDDYVQLEFVSLVGEELPRVIAWVREQGVAPYFLFLHTYAAHLPYGGYEAYRKESPERGLPSKEEILALDREVRKQGRILTQDEYLDLTIYNQLCEVGEERVKSGRKRLGPDYVHSAHFREDMAAIRRSYRRRLARIDEAIGALRSVLEAAGQWESTLLVITSDHGEAFFDHGLPLHGYVPFDEVLRVPLIVSYPHLGGATSASAPRRIEGLAWHLDLYPTLLSLAGLKVEETAQGLDLSNVLRGTGDLPADRAIFPLVLDASPRQLLPGRRVVIRDGQKYIEGHTRFGDSKGFFFDLRVDPSERNNQFTEQADARRELAHQLDSYRRTIKSFGRPRSTGPLELSPDEHEALRVLGYEE